MLDDDAEASFQQQEMDGEEQSLLDTLRPDDDVVELQKIDDTE